MTAEGEYDSDLIADRIAFLAVYVPIVKAELLNFVHLWNFHKIREQPEHPAAIGGVPFQLYHYPHMKAAQQCGFTVHPAQVDDIHREFVADFGTFGTFEQGALADP